MQNDLVHAWGLDMKLGYCAQVLYLWIHDLFSLYHFSETNVNLPCYREIAEGKWELWMINMLCTTGYHL